jgi:hypothetical protein
MKPEAQAEDIGATSYAAVQETARLSTEQPGALLFLCQPPLE